MSKDIGELRRIADDLVYDRLSRRDFLRRCGKLGLSAPMMSAMLGVTGSSLILSATPSHVQAAENTLVIASWGGGFGEAQRAAQFDPFIEETGIEIVLAPQQPDPAVLQAQVDSGDVTWDLAEVSLVGAGLLSNKGYLEPINYDAMDSAVLSGIEASVRQRDSVGIFYWPWVLGYNTSTLSKSPTSWRDMWDVEGFPAIRGLTEMNYEPPPFEIPFLANGVSPEDLYPMDIDRGFDLLTEIRPHITAWTGYGKNGATMTAQGELDMAPGAAPTFFRTRAEGGTVDWVWNQGLLYYDAWVMPKGAPHQDNATRFIEYTLRPDVQARFAEAYPGGPTAKGATAKLPPAIVDVSVAKPEIQAQTIKVDLEWWTKPDADGKANIDRVYERWATWIL
jgi:putative spermidine/putrescine transport system substrate-binding protein